MQAKGQLIRAFISNPSKKTTSVLDAMEASSRAQKAMERWAELEDMLGVLTAEPVYPAKSAIPWWFSKKAGLLVHVCGAPFRVKLRMDSRFRGKSVGGGA